MAQGGDTASWVGGVGNIGHDPEFVGKRQRNRRNIQIHFGVMAYRNNRGTALTGFSWTMICQRKDSRAALLEHDGNVPLHLSTKDADKSFLNMSFCLRDRSTYFSWSNSYPLLSCDSLYAGMAIDQKYITFRPSIQHTRELRYTCICSGMTIPPCLHMVPTWCPGTAGPASWVGSPHGSGGSTKVLRCTPSVHNLPPGMNRSLSMITATVRAGLPGQSGPGIRRSF